MLDRKTRREKSRQRSTTMPNPMERSSRMRKKVSHFSPMKRTMRTMRTTTATRTRNVISTILS